MYAAVRLPDRQTGEAGAFHGYSFHDSLPADIYEKAAAELGDTAKCEEDVLSYISFPPVAEKFFADRAAAEEKRCKYSIEAVED